jgi:hypothetical protein
VFRTVLFAVSLTFALSSSAVLAQTSAATPIPLSPKPDFSAMSYFVGSWSCSFRSARRPGPQHFTTVATLDPGGRWLVEKTEIQPVAWFPHAVSELDMITYDPFAKRWVDVETDSAGGYDLSATNGWSGDALVWKDLAFVPSNDVVSSTELRLKKISSAKYTSTNSFTTKKGRTVGTSTVCTKT